MRVLITGSSGYYGSILHSYLTSKGVACFGLDLFPSKTIPSGDQVICNLCNKDDLGNKLNGMRFDAIIHLASQIDFAVNNQTSLYENNVQSATNLIALCDRLGVSKFIFTSSNSVFLGNNKDYIGVDEIPIPVDEYGKSKLAVENILLKSKEFDVNILRCPNIIDSGRVGMLSILFDLIRENATLWVIGGGKIKHQCLYAQDLNSAMLSLLQFKGSTVHNIGSDRVPTFKEAFEDLVELAGGKSKIRSLPRGIVIPLLKMMHKLRISPMGPYQFRMLTQNFEFDLCRIKSDLNWRPTKNNTEILALAYEYYSRHLEQIKKNMSANSAPVNMGILSVLKYIKF